MRRAFGLISGLILVAATSVQAADYTITMKDGTFSPTPLTRTMGSKFIFTNKGAASHNTKLWGSVMPSWNSGQLLPNQSWSKIIKYAGQYQYICTYHSSGPGNGMWGRINIPTRASATSGSTSTTFTIRVATSDAPSGWVYDVLRKKGSGSWARWKYGTKSDTHSFRAGSLGAGSYYFKSRLRRTANNAVTGYSPAVRISVS